MHLQLQKHPLRNAKAVAARVECTFGVAYTKSAVTVVLNRPSVVYKNPKVVPGHAEAEDQLAFLAQYEKRKHDNGPEDLTLRTPPIRSTTR